MEQNIEIDLDKVKAFVEDVDFHQYLLLKTEDFNTAAFIL